MAIAADAAAQPQPQAPIQRGAPDFLFGQPKGSLGVRGSWLFANTGSDIFDFVTTQLTLEKRDFNAPLFSVEAGFAAAPRMDVQVGFEVGRAASPSEYRNLVDQNRAPITQDTTLTQVNVSGSVKVAVLPRGRAISRFAWIPRSVVPYVGGGGGFLWYDFKQDGDFVDFVDGRIFGATFESKGWTPSAHVFGGVDVRILRRVFLELEARHLWAEATLNRQFAGFDAIKLSGLRVTGGVNLVF